MVTYEVSLNLLFHILIKQRQKLSLDLKNASEHFGKMASAMEHEAKIQKESRSPDSKQKKIQEEVIHKDPIKLFKKSLLLS